MPFWAREAFSAWRALPAFGGQGGMVLSVDDRGRVRAFRRDSRDWGWICRPYVPDFHILRGDMN